MKYHGHLDLSALALNQRLNTQAMLRLHPTNAASQLVSMSWTVRTRMVTGGMGATSKLVAKSIVKISPVDKARNKPSPFKHDEPNKHFLI